SAAVGLIFALSTLLYLPEKLFVILAILGVQAFFLRHIYLYLVTTFNFYLEALTSFFASSQYIRLIMLGTIGIFTLLFYVFGSIGYVVKTWK
ncbi:MAG: hypothetical protein ACOC32_03590, partial [Nanoarchaeota archaeon]